MKSTLRLSLTAVILGLSAATFLRAADQPASPPPAPPPPSTTPPAGDSQHRPRGSMSPEKTLQMMSDRLSLTDDQKTKILPLLQAQADQMKALMSDDSLSREDRREKMRPIMQSTREKIRVLLTPEQQEKFDSMRGPGNRNGPPPADNLPPPPTGGNS